MRVSDQLLLARAGLVLFLLVSFFFKWSRFAWAYGVELLTGHPVLQLLHASLVFDVMIFMPLIGLLCFLPMKYYLWLYERVF